MFQCQMLPLVLSWLCHENTMSRSLLQLVHCMFVGWSGLSRLDKNQRVPPPPAAQTLSGGQPYWLALCYSPQWGPIERQPRVVTPSCMSPSVESWVHHVHVSVLCTRKLALFFFFYLCILIKICCCKSCCNVWIYVYVSDTENLHRC